MQSDSKDDVSLSANARPGCGTRGRRPTYPASLPRERQLVAGVRCEVDLGPARRIRRTETRAEGERFSSRRQHQPVTHVGRELKFVAQIIHARESHLLLADAEAAAVVL